MAQTLPLQHQKVGGSWQQNENSPVAPRQAPHTLNISVDPSVIPSTTTSDQPPVGYQQISPPKLAKKPSTTVVGSPTCSADANRSSFHSSAGIHTPDADLKWTSFNDDSEAEETPESR